MGARLDTDMSQAPITDSRTSAPATVCHSPVQCDWLALLNFLIWGADIHLNSLQTCISPSLL